MPLADPYVIPAVNEDHDVMVIYDIDSYDVNAYVTGGHGSVSPAGQSVPYGDTASIDITPDSGYHIETITDNDVAAGPGRPLRHRPGHRGPQRGGDLRGGRLRRQRDGLLRGRRRSNPA